MGDSKLRTQIEMLAMLQTVDREIKQQTGLKQGLIDGLEAKEHEIQARRHEVEILAAACSDREKLRAEKDRVFQDEGKKAMDKRMRMNRIKNVKELQALQREIDQMKQANSDLEEELIKIMQDIDAVKAQIKAKEAETDALQEELQRKQAELQTQIGGIDKAVSEAAARRQSIAAQLANDLISRYELIFARRGGTAVVEVSGGICQGCYMNIPPQLGNEIIKSEKLHLCPSCQRILYIKPSADQAEKTA
jgi:predicted  nucleic acid-binding Zn-ribbon protein